MNHNGKTHWLRNFFQVWALAALVVGVHAAEVVTESKPTVAPPASWVTPHLFERTKLLKPEANADQHWLLLEQQTDAASEETFHHGVRQILNVAGVQNGSTLKLDFNPSYQTLTLHWMRLWRGTNFLNRLELEKIRVVRRERDLDDQLLNGEQTAVLVMDDVRVGDVVDYAYSVRGANPVFNGKFSAGVRVQWNQPVERLFMRVLCPAGRLMFTKAHGASLQPTTLPRNGAVERVWDVRQVAGWHEEDALPIWCDPEPWVQFSEYKTWSEVNRWALALFQNTARLSPELLQKIAEWKRLATHEQQVLSALRFVQDEVRYFGIEIGVSTVKPADPSVVFARRFGDCKDKSQLFVTLLRGLGIEAFPVLVNTTLRHTLDEWQPTAGAFDHCIARVKCDGQTYWLDPTAGYQRGSLAMHYLPNYERGLVITPTTTALTVIPQTTGLPQTTTTEYFSLGGKTGSSTLKVVTVAEGCDADNLRAAFATTKRSDLEKNYTHFYADSYPKIRMTSPMEIADQDLENRFQVTEYYTIDQAWVRSDKNQQASFGFYADAMATLLKKPVDTERKLPLGVAFPQHQILRKEITLPEWWPWDDENKTIVDPAFTFRKHSQARGRNLVVEYEYQAQADSVPAERTGEYLQKLDDVSKTLGYTLHWQ
jgi:hypothetical protein